MPLHVSSTCAHHQEVRITLHSLWYHHTYRCFSLQPRHYSSITAPNLQPTENQERNDQCGNQHYSRELLMMGTVMPEIF